MFQLSSLTLVLLNCLFLLVINSNLGLLTQFLNSSDEKYLYLWKIDISNIELLDELSIYQKLIKFSDISIRLKLAWNRIIYGRNRTMVSAIGRSGLSI